MDSKQRRKVKKSQADEGAVNMLLEEIAALPSSEEGQVTPAVTQRKDNLEVLN